MKQVEAAGELAFVRAITYRASEVPPGVSALDGTPGVLLLDAELPLAPTREFAAPILGTVGDVTAEMIKDDPDLYRWATRRGCPGCRPGTTRSCAAPTAS